MAPGSDGTPLSTFWQPRYWGIWFAVGVLRIVAFLPYRQQMLVGRGLGRLAFQVLRRRRRIATVNISLCFPNLGLAAREELLHQHFASLGMTVIEHGLAWWADDALVRSLVELRGVEHLLRAMEGGRGVVLLTGHFGPQEFSGRAFALACPAAAGFYRPNRNQLVDSLLKRVRARSAPDLIPKSDLRRVVRTLRRGTPVWYASDQSYSGAQSTLVPFCGEPAMTTTALSDLVRLGKAAVVPLLPTRLPDGRGYLLEILPPLADFPGASPVADAARVNALLEAHIRKVPAQYYWIHRRFKRRPEPYGDPYQSGS